MGMDQCSCKCFHEAQWTCEGESVVCKAKYGAGELQTVGDKVCEVRGAPKPENAAELRVASTCEPITEMRGSAPTEQCLAQWGTPEPTDAPAVVTEAPVAATEAPVERWRSRWSRRSRRPLRLPPSLSTRRSPSAASQSCQW